MTAPATARRWDDDGKVLHDKGFRLGDGVRAACDPRAAQTVASPDGRLTVTLGTGADDQPTSTLSVGGRTVIAIAEAAVENWPAMYLTGTETGAFGLAAKLARRPDDPPSR